MFLLQVGVKGVAVLEKVLNNSAGDASFPGRVGVVDYVHADGGLVPEFPGVLVLKLSEAACLCGGEQVAEEAFRPAGFLRRDGAERKCQRSLGNQPAGVESKPATLRRGIRNRFIG